VPRDPKRLHHFWEGIEERAQGECVRESSEVEVVLWIHCVDSSGGHRTKVVKRRILHRGRESTTGVDRGESRTLVDR
jgi:hypothetical protein